jgi:hypothetical protein
MRTKHPGMAEPAPTAPWSKMRFREADLDSSEMTELVEGMFWPRLAISLSASGSASNLAMARPQLLRWQLSLLPP